MTAAKFLGETPAFPSAAPESDVLNEGMTLREYVAAQIFAARYARHSISPGSEAGEAERVVELADALLAKLSKPSREAT